MQKILKRHLRKIGAAAAIVALAIVMVTGGAMVTGDARAQSTNDEVNDPFEDFNRSIFSFNLKLDRAVLKPLAKGYRAVVPAFGRDMIQNFLNNLRTPIILVNDVLQGKPDRAGITIHRFLFNSTFGLFGIIDFVGDLGIEGHNEDFGQTLAVWGVGEGPYLVLPILGPSPPRDAVGLGVDTLFDPLVLYNIPSYIPWTRTVVRGIDDRSRHIESLDEIEETAIDFYATIRSLYRQRRNDQIRDGAPPPTIPIPTISLDFDEDEGKERVSSLPAS